MGLHRKNNYFAYVTEDNFVVNFDSNASRLECQAVAKKQGVHFEPVQGKKLSDEQKLNAPPAFIGHSGFELHLQHNFFRDAESEAETEKVTVSNQKETHDEHRIINEAKTSREGTRDAGCGVHPKGDSRGNGTEVSHSGAVFQQPRETDCNRRDATPNAQTPSGDRELERSRTATWHDAASDSILARGR